MTVLNTASVQQIVTPAFIDGLDQEIRPEVLFLTLAQIIPAKRRTGSFTLPAQIVSGPSVGWLGEGETKPVSSMSFDRDVVHMKKAAVVVPFSDELELDSFVSIGEMIRQAISRAAAQELDEKMWNGAGGTDLEPLGLLQSPGIQTVVHSGAANLDTDLERMILALRVENHRPGAFVMSEATLHALATLKDLDGRPRYQEARTPGAPTFMGVPILASNNLPITPTTDGQSSPVVLADWRHVQVYTAPSSFSISDSATIIDGADEIQLWQRDMQAIRWVQHVSDVRVRHPQAVCIMEGVETEL